MSILLFRLSSDPTLTTHNVVDMMEWVEYEDLQVVLNASYGKWIEIRGQYQSDEQRSEALIAHTISTHPCMSWGRLARGLQQCECREAAAEVTWNYVEGKLRAMFCAATWRAEYINHLYCVS